MMKSIAFGLALALAAPAAAQDTAQSPAGPWDPAARLAAQREAMQALAFLDGVWRGSATGEEVRTSVVHTERVGTLLGGAVRLVEGRAYDAEGRSPFNAFAIISYDPARRSYAMRSYAMGYAADFPLEVRPDGYSWSRPAGAPGATIRYTATVRDGVWHEIGERLVGDAAPVRTIELRLRRVGSSDWPQAGAVPPR
jgi:hypothetical protein